MTYQLPANVQAPRLACGLSATLPSLRLHRVYARRAHIMILGTLLALMALVGVSTLSTWHGATAYHDDPVATVSDTHAHGSAALAPDAHSTADLDDTIHVAAHVVMQGLALPSAVDTAVYAAATEPSWSRVRADFLPGLQPASLLRPPRA